jgi:hypothetical protein
MLAACWFHGGGLFVRLATIGTIMMSVLGIVCLVAEGPDFTPDHESCRVPAGYTDHKIRNEYSTVTPGAGSGFYCAASCGREKVGSLLYCH